MLFNSINFAFFLPIIVAAFYLISHKYRAPLLLIASYYFYMSWKVEYALLIVFSTLVDYFCGIYISKAQNQGRKKLFLFLSLFVNLGLLFFFKYFDFFTSNISSLLPGSQLIQASSFGNILLPVGISFYTFQTISYTLDVYFERRQPERNLGYFALYVSFFPQLVAGPIERSGDLIPQLRSFRSFNLDTFKSGLKLIAYGFFKKLVVADRLAIYVDEIYSKPDEYAGIRIAIATVFFAFQIYTDFSAYTDIARGSARLLGVNLSQNFKQPYMSKSISEIWNRWHITLSVWIRDYLYTPLTISWRNQGKYGIHAALILSFTLIGLWHGANWTFIIFGFIHGLILSFEFISRKRRNRIIKKTPKWLVTCISVPFVFMLWSLTCIFFRSESLSKAFSMFLYLFNGDYNLTVGFETTTTIELAISFLVIIVVWILDYVHEKYSLTKTLKKFPFLIRIAVYLMFVNIILYFGWFRSEQFIYFQF